MTKRIYILWHLGLGDALVCNALVREYAKRYDEVVVPVKCHNMHSVVFMFGDLPNVQCAPVTGDGEAERKANEAEANSIEVLRLGIFMHKPWPIKNWDTEFYVEAGLDPLLRWSGFRYPAIHTQFVAPENTPFLHEDASRGFVIRRQPHQRYWQPDHRYTVFEHVFSIQNSPQLHCIDSSFLHLCDLIGGPDRQTLFWHKYARPDGKGVPPCMLKRQWAILV